MHTSERTNNQARVRRTFLLAAPSEDVRPHRAAVRRLVTRFPLQVEAAALRDYKVLGSRRRPGRTSQRPELWRLLEKKRKNNPNPKKRVGAEPDPYGREHSTI